MARYFEEEFQYRNTAASLALKLGQPIVGMGMPIRQAAPELDVTAFVTDQAVAPGHRFSIVVDIVPGTGMRVMGPGQQTYRVVALALEPSANLRLYRMTYPQTAELAAGPGGTRLPAYAQPFRLVQDAAIVVNNEMRQLAQKPGATATLKGVVEYQACTDTTCGPPRQVPVSFTLALKPLG